MQRIVKSASSRVVSRATLTKVRRNYKAYAKSTRQGLRYPELKRQLLAPTNLKQSMRKPKIWASSGALALITLVTINLVAIQANKQASFAATTGIEAEAGTLTVPATTISDTSASGRRQPGLMDKAYTL